jgi:ligand-binding sensor domain-containing protein
MKILKITLFFAILLASCSPKSSLSIVQMEVHQKGNWTIYIAPEWQKQKESISISSMAIATDGSLWFGTTGGPVSIGTGVYRFDGKLWTRYTSENSGLPADEVSSIAANPDGTIWFTTFCCGVSRFDGKTWTTYTAANELAENDVRSSAVAPNGSAWFGTEDKGVSRFDGKNWTTYTQDNGLSANSIGHITVLPDKSLLFSVSNGMGLVGLDRFDEKEWTVFPTPEKLTKTYTFDIAAAPAGTLWFVTEKYGVFSLSGDTWTKLHRAGWAGW